MRKKFTVVCVILLMMTMLVSNVYASTGPVVSASDFTGVTVDESNGGTTNSAEGAFSVLPIYWNQSGSFEGDECTEGTIYKTVYQIDPKIATKGGGNYHFLSDYFLGISPTEIVSKYASELTKPTDLSQWSKDLLKSNAMLKQKSTASAGWNYTVSADGKTATITYTMSAQDEAVMKEKMAGTENGLYFTAIFAVPFVSEKLDGAKNEAANYTISYTSTTSSDGGNTWVSYPEADGKVRYMTDKKDVEIKKQIALIDPDSGALGEYKNAEDGVIWFKPGQKAKVKITLTRPTGAQFSGRQLITDYIPANTLYTDNFTNASNSYVLTADSTNTVASLSEVYAGYGRKNLDWAVSQSVAIATEPLAINNGTFVLRFTGLLIGGILTCTYDIQAPDSVDDPGTTEVETLRYFYSNANVINDWQRTIPKYVGSEASYEWAAAIATAYGVTLDTMVYTMDEYVTKTPEFTLGLSETSGALTVEETVSGSGDTQKEFNFTVKLDAAISGTYGDMTFKEGVATFTLKHGEKKMAEKLPAGIGYTVSESNNSGYTVTVKKNQESPVTGNTISGTIATDSIEQVTFNNHQSPYIPAIGKGGLLVSKTVTGKGDREKPFTFTVTLNTALTGTYGDMEFKNGVASFTLKDGENKMAAELPAGTAYTVTESDNQGYIVTVNNGNLEVGQGTIPANTFATVAFTNDMPQGTDSDEPDTPNTPNKPDTPQDSDKSEKPDKEGTSNEPSKEDTTSPKTGDNLNITLWCGLLVSAMAGAAAVLVNRKKKVNNRR